MEEAMNCPTFGAKALSPTISHVLSKEFQIIIKPFDPEAPAL